MKTSAMLLVSLAVSTAVIAAPARLGVSGRLTRDLKPVAGATSTPESTDPVQTVQQSADPVLIAQPADGTETHHLGQDAVHRWNRIAIDAAGLDHTPGYRQQLGPGRS